VPFQLSEVLKAIGPSASIIFAAWIFLDFLQTRYDSAIQRYQELLQTYRSGDVSEERAPRVRDEIKVYARRCRLMSLAVSLGLVGAILLVTTIIFGEVDVLAPKIVLVQCSAPRPRWSGSRS